MKAKYKITAIITLCIAVIGLCGCSQNTKVATIQPKQQLEAIATAEVNEDSKIQKLSSTNNDVEKQMPETGTSYKKVDEYVYVTASSLNVRSGAGTGYSKVGALSKNTKVHRVGIGTNGWSKIEYKGKVRYVSSQYLTTKKSSTTSNTSSTSTNMYVTASSLNVRSGPGTSYKKIGTLSRNDKVQKISASNGWTKIKYNGKTAYVSSQYLSSKKVTSNSVLSEMNRRGNIGRLKISSVGVDVALFEVSVYNGKANQRAVDNSDSAAYMKDAVEAYGCILIGDHRHQGFDKMKKSVPNKTTAVIDFGTHKKTYICTKNFKGKNTGSDLVDMKGVSIDGKNNGGITMYTCNTDKTITITYWKEK